MQLICVEWHCDRMRFRTGIQQSECKAVLRSFKRSYNRCFELMQLRTYSFIGSLCGLHKIRFDDCVLAFTL